MTQRQMDPAHFRERMHDTFGPEPAHAPVETDLRRGRSRLRRRRATSSLATLVAVGVAGTGVAVGLSSPGSSLGPTEVAPAAQPEPTVADILAQCTTGENAYFVDGTGQRVEQAAVQLLGTSPTLMTSAVTDNRTQATLRSQDGRHWASCQFRNAPDNGVKNDLAVFPTEVSFPRAAVDGAWAYEPARESDPRFQGGVNSPLPQLEVPCVNALDGAERRAANAACAEFTVTWNDRRPAEVAAVKVVTPDGEASWADVRRGYLSFAYTGEMTPEIAEQVARGEAPGAQRVVFYDADGDVLVDDRDPGAAPATGELSLEHFPSLAWWLK